MGNKIKPWHRRKPKHHERGDERRKRVIPLRTGGDRRIIPLTVDDSQVVPLTVGDDFDLDEGSWEN